MKYTLDEIELLIVKWFIKTYGKKQWVCTDPEKLRQGAA